ncbi:MAG: hypothetical protein LCH58_10325 [Bacteroidetes bacterium]|uniref:hypothetical protein n=1 Tax=Phnomibacter sp. TaxID=2836217 RepID=UPI002FDE17EA|nr:hypothetical protein [Bacteroidota bacterium]
MGEVHQAPAGRNNQKPQSLDFFHQQPPTIFWDKDFPVNYNPDSYREQTFTSYLIHRFTAFYFIN